MGASASRHTVGWPAAAVPVLSRDYEVASHEILPRVRLGDLSAACDPDEVALHRISHIVSTVGVEKMREVGVRYFTFMVDDTPEAPVWRYFADVHNWIDDALGANNSNVVLVHCVAGVSRSSTILISYVMHARRMRLADAFRLVQRSRTIVDPNIGFQAALLQFDRHLHAGGPWPPDGSAVQSSGAKFDPPRA